MNDAWLGGNDVDVTVEVEELADYEQSDRGELVTGAEPSDVQHLVQGY